MWLLTVGAGSLPGEAAAAKADYAARGRWYAHFDIEDALARLKSDMPKKAVCRTKAQIPKARTRDSTQTLAKLTTVTDGRRRTINDPPLIVPLEELAARLDVDAVYWFLRRLFTGYARTLLAYRRGLVERFALTRVARKVGSVGSVGTETWILLMEPDDGFGRERDRGQSAGGKSPPGDGRDHIGTPRPDLLIPALDEGQLTTLREFLISVRRHGGCLTLAGRAM